MGRRKMNDPKTTARSKRSAWRWALVGTLALSLIVNLALAVKITVFASNYPFHPLCHGGRHYGLLVLREPMSIRYKKRMHYNIDNLRLSRDGTLFISYWKWRNEKGAIWNISTAIAEDVYEEEKGIKRMTQQEREKLQTARCKFIRKYALKNPKANWKKVPAR